MGSWMITSLGGSPEPIKKCIDTYGPANIVFLASHDSVALAGEILKGRDPKPGVAYEITDAPNSLFESYKKLLRPPGRGHQASPACDVPLPEGNRPTLRGSLLRQFEGD